MKNSLRVVWLQCGHQPHRLPILAVAQRFVLHRFATLGRAVSATPPDARSNEGTFGCLRKPCGQLWVSNPRPRGPAAGINAMNHMASLSSQPCWYTFLQLPWCKDLKITTGVEPTPLWRVPCDRPRTTFGQAVALACRGVLIRDPGRYPWRTNLRSRLGPVGTPLRIGDWGRSPRPSHPLVLAPFRGVLENPRPYSSAVGADVLGHSVQSHANALQRGG